jgi:hypothetical protein
VAARRPALALAALAAACDGGPPPPVPIGLSNMSPGVEVVADDLGVDRVRQTLQWRWIEPEVLATGLTLADARAPGALAAYVDGRDFAQADAAVARWTSRGIDVLAGVGSGWDQTLPALDGEPANPDALGPDEYVARQALAVGALVERYDGDGHLDAPGSPRIARWQVENELNEAVFTAFGGLRSPGGTAALRSTWADAAFRDALLDALVAAVRDADPSASVTTNLHCSVHPNFDAAFDVEPWDAALVRWRDRLDAIGLDVYPNYLSAEPPRPERVADAIARARDLAEGRPIEVVETGYPTGPAELGFDEARQVAYLDGLLRGARDEGAAALYWYGSHTRETTDVEIDADDVATVAKMAAAYEAGDVTAAFALAAEHQDGHLGDVIASVEAYWGLIRADGTRKPGWDLLADAVAAAAPP